MADEYVSAFHIHDDYNESIADILSSPRPNAPIRTAFMGLGMPLRVNAKGFDVRSLHFRLNDPLTPFQSFDHAKDAYDYAHGHGPFLAAARELRRYVDGEMENREDEVRARYDVILERPGLEDSLRADVARIRDNLRTVGSVAKELDDKLDPHLYLIGLRLVRGPGTQSARSAQRFLSYARWRIGELLSVHDDPPVPEGSSVDRSTSGA